MLVVIVIAALAILAAVVFLATGHGGGLSPERADYAPLELGPVSATDVVLLRPPAGLWGYNVQATDEALERIAASIRERDVRIVALEQLVTDLSRDQLPAIPLASPYAGARHRRPATAPGQTYSRPVPAAMAETDETAWAPAARSTAVQPPAAQPPAGQLAAEESAERPAAEQPAARGDAARGDAAEAAERLAAPGAAETAESPLVPGAGEVAESGVLPGAGETAESAVLPDTAELAERPVPPGAGETEAIRWPTEPVESLGPDPADRAPADGPLPERARARARANGLTAGRGASSGPPPEQSHE
ncbi:MAG TPA: hypothetical protein VHF26_15600 [Trebonia sp.]|nr:hypothetical protein [Trebonia sp.]